MVQTDSFVRSAWTLASIAVVIAGLYLAKGVLVPLTLALMLSAVVVGAVGIHALHRAGLVELHLKPTRLASNIIGGLVFGAGFALSAYCPGTGAAALGQGNYDAIAMMVGMIAGSYLFVELSGWISRHIDPIGDLGKVTLYDWLGINRTVVLAVSVLILCGVLAAIELLADR